MRRGESKRGRQARRKMQKSQEGKAASEGKPGVGARVLIGSSRSEVKGYLTTTTPSQSYPRSPDTSWRIQVGAPHPSPNTQGPGSDL